MLKEVVEKSMASWCESWEKGSKVWWREKGIELVIGEVKV